MDFAVHEATALAYKRQPLRSLKSHRKRERKSSQEEIPKSFFNVRKRRELGWGWGKRVNFLSSSIIIC
jgi:hypothetical protein